MNTPAVSLAKNPQTFSLAAAQLYDGINGACDPDQLDNAARRIWEVYGLGRIGDDEATFLAECVERRRPPRHHWSSDKPIGRLAGVISSRFPKRRPQRSPDRAASRNRRRLLGGSSGLPDTIRHHYSEGERAVLYVIAAEVKRCGVCDRSLDELAARAGTGRTTAQNALRAARDLRHVTIEHRPVPGQKNRTNVVRIVSVEWLIWLRRGPHTRVQSVEHHEEQRFKKEVGEQRKKGVTEPQNMTLWRFRLRGNG
jgi:hypothetical protein